MARRGSRTVFIWPRYRERTKKVNDFNRNEVFGRDNYASALILGEDALRVLGFGAYRAKQAAHIFHDHDQALLRELQRTEAPETRRMLSLKAREQLERILTADEEEITRSNREGWE